MALSASAVLPSAESAVRRWLGRIAEERVASAFMSLRYVGTPRTSVWATCRARPSLSILGSRPPADQGCASPPPTRPSGSVRRDPVGGFDVLSVGEGEGAGTDEVMALLTASIALHSAATRSDRKVGRVADEVLSSSRPSCVSGQLPTPDTSSGRRGCATARRTSHNAGAGGFRIPSSATSRVVRLVGTAAAWRSRVGPRSRGRC